MARDARQSRGHPAGCKGVTAQWQHRAQSPAIFLLTNTPPAIRLNAASIPFESCAKFLTFIWFVSHKMRRRSRPAPKAVSPQAPAVAQRGGRGFRYFTFAAVLITLGLGFLVLTAPSNLQVTAEMGKASVALAANDAPPPTTTPEATPEPKGKHHKDKGEKGEEGKDKEKKEAKEGKESKSEVKNDRKEQDEFFERQDIVPYFKFEFLPEEWEYIHKDARRYAEATMMDGDNPQTWKGVAVKLKGSAGSFQGPDQKPGLSISMAKYQKAERWNGFLKWHLNNGAQDNSFLNEQISCEIARKAGVPASRCAHALVKWQNRDLGLYVFKEAFDRDFLAKFWKNTGGDLYDGGFVHELDANMEKDEGDRERRDNIRELISACQEGDQKKRWDRLDKILDVDEFISFIAVEALVCHWDGYNFNRNNYRLYFDADTGKAVFFLHGTDQTFGDANFPVTRDSGAMVGQAVMSNPLWKAAYRERVERIYNEILKPFDWGARVNEVGEKFRAAIALHNPQMAKEYEQRIKEAHDRVVSRIAGIGKQLGDLPKPFKFENGVAKLDGEGWNAEGSAAVSDSVNFDGKQCYHIRATDGGSVASWRKALTLGPGKYKLIARVRTAGVVPSPSTSGEGAGLRISGGTRNGQSGDTLVGDTPWTDAVYQVESPGGDIVMVAELRATKGEVWFDRNGFRLEQVK